MVEEEEEREEEEHRLLLLVDLVCMKSLDFIVFSVIYRY